MIKNDKQVYIYIHTISEHSILIENEGCMLGWFDLQENGV